jgi:hypothetical protein
VLGTAWLARRWWAVRILDDGTGINYVTAWHVPFEGQTGMDAVPLWVKLLPLSYIQSIEIYGSDHYPPEIAWAVKVCGRVDEVLIHGIPRGDEPQDAQATCTFLASLGPLPELKRLQIRDMNLTDAELAPLLAGYPRLRELWLWATAWTGAGFPVLKELELIVIYDSPVSDAGLTAMLRSPALRSVEISQGWMTRDGLRQIPRDRQPALRDISIIGAKIAAEEVAELNDTLHAACPGLQIQVMGRFEK